jgi:hypothetical protein
MRACVRACVSVHSGRVSQVRNGRKEGERKREMK